MDAAPPSRRVWILITLSLLLGLALRLMGASGDLWYDELWSLEHSQRAEQLPDLFLDPALQHDNNHWLNTAWMRALGPDRSSLAYRSLALLGGAGTLVLLLVAGLRRGTVAGVLIALAASTSWLLVLYSSEARGYGTVCLFAVAGFLLVDDARRRPGAIGFVPFWLVTALGTLSHLSYLYIHLALTAWSILRLRAPEPRRWILRLLAWHAVPTAFLAALYFMVLRHIVIGGGPGYDSILQVVSQTLANVFGLHGDEAAVTPLIAAMVGAALIQVVLLAVRRDDRALFYAFALLLSPAAFLLLRPPEVLYVRYFLVCLPFLLLCLAELGQRLWRSGPTARVSVAVFAVVLLLGNGARLEQFARLGRGAGSETVRYLLEHTPEPSIQIAVDGQHNAQLLSYHARRLEASSRLVLLDPRSGLRRAPRWVLSHSLEQDFTPPPELRFFGTRYRLVQEARWPGLSGWAWFLYHDQNR